MRNAHAQKASVCVCTAFVRWRAGSHDATNSAAEEESVAGKRKREDPSMGSSKHQKKEEEVYFVFQELKEKHGTTYDTPRSPPIYMMTLIILQLYQCLHQVLVNPVLLHFEMLSVELQQPLLRH